MPSSSKNLTQEEARQKIYRYCTYQERSHQEVKSKLYDFGLRKTDVDEILSHLIVEGFLNEERFAKAFAGGKFRMKKWGRLKIIHELEAKGLTQNCIRSGMEEIDEQQYVETLNQLIRKKADLFTEENDFIKKNKLAKYAIRKGYEPNLVWEILKKF